MAESLLRLFGHPALERDGIVTAISTRPKALALLALTVAGHGRPVAREWLAQTLWPDSELEEGRANVRRHLQVLREALGDGALLLSRYSVQWNAKGEVAVDALVFEDSVVQKPETAVELYRGEFCQGLDEEALHAYRIRYRTLYESALDALTGDAQRNERYSEAIRWSKHALVVDPFDEKHVRVLMRARERIGDRTGALNEYRALSARLKAELNTEPEPETTALFETLVHAGGSACAPHNLPAQETSFVGREAELAELMRLAQEQCVVSIVGTGGIGKTRLASRFALNHSSRYFSGVWLVAAEHGDTAADLWRRLAATANITAPNPREHVMAEFRSGERLVIFDSCEHALEAAREVAGTLRESTNAHVIATTRRRLGLERERMIELAPLEAPARAHVDGAQTLLQYPAYRLFVERAVSASPSFRATAEAAAIVALLGKMDALPLAIELTAARLRHFSLRTLLERHGTSTVPMKLEQTIASSYEALGPQERRIFCALSVFRGSFSLAAAESVYGASAEPLIAELVDASLLQMLRAESEVRYRMLDVLRTFAAERLENEREMRERHAHYYAELARAYQSHFRSPEEIEYFRRADADAENFSLALRWSTDNDAALAAHMARSLAHYCVFRWDFAAIDRTIERLLDARNASTLNERERGALLLVSGLLAKAKVDSERAITNLREAREIFRRQSDAAEEIEAIFALAVVTFNCGLLEDALALFEQALAMQRAVNDEYGTAQTMLNMAATFDRLGLLERSLHLQTQALHQFERIHFPRGIAYAYRALAVTNAHLHKLQDAIEAARASVAIFETLDDARWLADALTTLANQLTEAGKCEEAVAPLRRALAMLPAMPNPVAARDACQSMVDVMSRLGHFSESALAYGKAESLGRRHGLITGQAYEVYLRPIVDRVRANLGEGPFRALCARGASMSIEDLLQAFDAAAGNLD